VSHIDQAEMQRLMNIGARYAIYHLIFKYDGKWPEGMIKLLKDELADYKEADHGLV